MKRVFKRLFSYENNISRVIEEIKADPHSYGVVISPDLTAITISGTNMNGAKNFNISSYVEDWRSLTVNNFGFRGVTAESFNENGATSAYRQYASVSIQAYDNTTGTLTLNCSQQVVHNNENNQTRSTSINSITVYVFH